jgi:hypothetical protein
MQNHLLLLLFAVQYFRGIIRLVIIYCLVYHNMTILIKLVVQVKTRKHSSLDYHSKHVIKD